MYQGPVSLLKVGGGDVEAWLFTEAATNLLMLGKCTYV